MRASICLLFIAGLAWSHTGHAHKRWLLPTDFSLSDAETVTVDFSASNNIFYVDKPMPLDGLRALAPSGSSPMA